MSRFDCQFRQKWDQNSKKKVSLFFKSLNGYRDFTVAPGITEHENEI